MTVLKVGLVQFSAVGDPEENRANALAGITTAVDRGADLVVPHELVSTQYFPAFPVDDAWFDTAEPVTGPTVGAVARIAREAGIGVLVPWFETVAPGRYANSAALIDEHGAVIDVWRKIHVPRVQVPGPAGAIPVDEKYYFEPGHEPYRVVTWRGVRVGVMICHDRHFPECARALTLAGADLLLVPSTSRGIPDSADPVRTWRTELAATAIQNCVYVAATNRTGVEANQEFLGNSLVVDPSGDEVLRLGPDPEVGVVEIDATESVRVRRARGFIRDRRPELYGALVDRHPGDVR